jgi:hypothetical protein
MRKAKTKAAVPSQRPPSVLPDLALGHAQALWVLAQLGFAGKTSPSTFAEYIKSLRKLGAPFDKARNDGRRRGHTVIYTYLQLMEVALVLTLRVYHVVPDSILLEIIRNRVRLYRCYQQAYTNRKTGVGAPVVVKATGHRSVRLRGAYLDLRINFSGGKLTNFGPPHLLSPVEALAIFARGDIAARAFQPINLSCLAEHVVSTSLSAPHVRRGPPRRRGTPRRP